MNSGYYCPKAVSKNGGSLSGGVCIVDTNSKLRVSTSERGLRPVFILNSGVKIIGGNGSIDKPYELGL